MTAAREPVAIIGMAVTVPGAGDLGTYWRNLVDGFDAITAVPEGRWHPEGITCRRGGFVDGLVDFDPAEFGIMPTAVPGTEPDQLIALRTAAAALADAGGALPGARARVGIVLGRGGYLTPRTSRLDQRVRTSAQLTRTMREVLPDLDDERLGLLRTAFLDALGPYGPGDGLGLVPNFAASRVANRLDLRGPAYTVDAACASSLVAVDHAVTELTRGRCDVMLAGGVHHCHDATLWSVFADLGALSPSQRIRPFHRDADGMLLAEGTGVMVLKRLADAQRSGDRVYAVVRGVGLASDGRTASLVTPDPAGQARAVRLAWAEAGLDPAAPDALGLLEAHGTGTPGGDAAELAVLAEVFGVPDTGPDAVLGSVKSMIGHTMPAAGAVGMVKAALAIHHGVLPPTLHCDAPHPALRATRFRPAPAARPWEAGVRRAAVNAFGFGGINAHVVLEGPPGQPTPAPASRPRRAAVTERDRVLRLSADSPQALAALLDTDDAALRAVDACGSGPARLAIAGPGDRRLALARKAVARGRLWGGRGDLWFAPTPLLGPGAGRTAFVFPGLEAAFSPRVDDVADHFGTERPDTGQLKAGDVTAHTAALFDVGGLLSAALDRMGIRPDAVAGHSAGEWTAMIAGGIFREDRPGAALRDAVVRHLRLPPLSFLALGAPAAQVEDALPGYPGVALSHDDAPHQCVVCGPQEQLEALAARLRGEGVLGRVLTFQSGFHTPMLAPYLDGLRDALPHLAIHPPRTPVWSATLVAPFPGDEAGIRDLFIRHLLEPVRFRQLTEAMYAAGFRVFVQVGTGQLPALIGDTLAGRAHLAVAANSPRRSGLAQLDRVAAALWTVGAEPDLTALGGRRATVGIDLGTGPVSLRPQDRERLRAALGRTGRGSGTPLRDLAQRIPAAAELEALLTETATTAAELFTAAERPREPGRATSRATAPAVAQRVVEVDVDHMPYLLDHCFYRQRPDWPDLADRRPVVPATTIVQLMLDAAGAAGTPVALRDARFLEWVVATPPARVELTVTAGQDGDGWYRAAFGHYARADIRTAAAYPEPPAPWPCDEPETAPPISARELYEQGWMFHGPGFQGVTDIVALGERHVRGVLTCLDAPGVLLDSVGQLIGYWLMVTHTDRVDVLPVGVREIVFHGPPPARGSRVDCHIRITRLTDKLLEADARLVHEGRVWAVIHGWQDRRFDSNPTTIAVRRRSDRHTLSAPQPGGWQLVFDQWPDPASLELMMLCQLAGEERAAFARRPVRGRRQWLLGRVAAKDAVRRHLWDHGAGPVFPGEVRVRNEPSGRPRPEGVHGLRLPPLDLSLAHCQEAAVALVRPAGTRVGIDIEEITERPAATRDTVLAPGERALFQDLGGGPEQLTRFWTAKEAAAKAEGTGLRGDPRGFLVTATDPGRADALTVRAPSGRSYTIRLARVDNPPGARPRSYIVAWTAMDEAHSPPKTQMNGQQS
ncbi:beta-ketoacyl synthase N-terminal-like domain-containing protein [Streptomyces albireticuli]|nr:beta-ketoacyl synthase N-terminal-like domain-containing protein [Streptomyces albireticuli]